MIIRAIKYFILGVLGSLFLFVGAFSVVYLWDQHHVDVPLSAYGSGKSQWNQNLKVAVIGDSWAARHKLDNFLNQELAHLNLKSVVVSYGHVGASSREVLMDLLSQKASRPLLADPEIDVFVVFAGVNDSQGHDGPEMYNYHMKGILRLLRSYGVGVIVIEIPEYEIGRSGPPTFVHRLKLKVSQYLFDKGRSDNRPEYRAKLRELVAGASDVSVVPKEKIPAFAIDPQLYRDPVHLNPKGYAILAHEIAEHINAMCYHHAQ